MFRFALPPFKNFRPLLLMGLLLTSTLASATSYEMRIRAPGVKPAGAAVVPSGDPYFSQVSLLMHMDGTAGAASFVDVKGNTVARLGSPLLSATSSKFGPTSISLNGVDQALTFSNTTFDFGAGDYTVEGYILPKASNASYQTILGNSWGWQLYLRNNTLEFYTSNSATYGTYSLTSGMTTPALVVSNTWNHFAVVRKGTQLTLYVNGALGATGTLTGSMPAPVYTASIGALYNGTAYGYFFNGSVDEVRVTKGFARYTGAFTPSAQAFLDN